MPKKRRSRQRQRLASRPAPVLDAAADRTAPRDPIRPRFTRPGTVGRAAGQPSAALLKASTAEVGYVTKDLRRIGLVAGGCVALLAVAAVTVNVLVK